MPKKTDKPQKTDPLTLDEMAVAADLFIDRFNIIKTRMPITATTEDTLKVMENVAKLGHKLRADKAEEERLGRFGFLKGKEAGDPSVSNSEYPAFPPPPKLSLNDD